MENTNVGPNKTKIKKFKNGFNVYAFLFSSFYYWYHGASLLFVLYVFMPMLFVAVFLLFMNPLTAIATGYLLSHTIAGCRANKDLNKFEKQQCFYKIYANPKAPVLFFSISIKRLIFFSILTGGLYEVYWLYKNWAAVKKATHEEIYPVFRSWFLPVFYIFQLCHRIKKNVERFKPAGFLLSAMCIVYPLVFIAESFFVIWSRRIENESLYLKVLIINWLIMLVGILCLIPIQQAINFNNKSLESKQEPARVFYTGEVILLIVSFCLWGLNIGALFYNPAVETQKLQGHDVYREAPSDVHQPVNEQEEALVFFMGMSYRYMIGFPNVCRQEGYVMKQFPAAYQKKFGRELQKLDEFLLTQNMSLNNIDSLWPREMIYQLGDSIIKEIDVARKEIILGALSQRSGQSVEAIEWSDKFYEMVSRSDICALLDEEPEIALEDFKSSMPAILENAGLVK